MAAALLCHHPYLPPIRFSPSLTRSRLGISIRCSDSNRGFGPKSTKLLASHLPFPNVLSCYFDLLHFVAEKRRIPLSSNLLTVITPSPYLHYHCRIHCFFFFCVYIIFAEAPVLSSPTGGARKTNYTSADELEFEQRLQAIRKSALEQKEARAKKEYGAIDYDAPTEKNSDKVGLLTKIGVGVAVAVFGLVFALGDFLPSGSVSPAEKAATVNKISQEERAILAKRLKEFEETLATSPEDSNALEGAAVTLAEMQDYERAATFLEKLTEKKPRDHDVFRLLGEVQYELKDYEKSVLAYRNAEKASESLDFEILRGLTNSLLAARKPDEAVQMLLAARERLNKEKPSGDSSETVKSTADMRSDVDPVQVDLLLGKAYSDWGHISDALAVYNQLITSHPDDFRGYLAKGIILKENGSVGDAERMFIQARFFAPDKAKALVDRYSRQ